jgi:FKBP-type peptidyl-prolyl cis-trans isomerase
MNFSTAKLSFSIVFCLIIIISCRRPYTPEAEKNYEQENAKKLVEMNKALVRKDRLKILGYQNRNHLKSTETGTGLWYTLIEKGNGPQVKKGDLVKLDYTVSLLDGTRCYDSKKDGIKAFFVGHGGVESGLEEGVLLLHLGDKAKFILPPHLAHGLTGDGNKIPARAIIIYDVELLSIQ